MRQGWRRYLEWAGAALLAFALAGCNGSSGNGATGDDGSPYQSEGSADDPVEIVYAPVGRTQVQSYAGEVDRGTSYYIVTGLTAGTAYVVQLRNLLADADLKLYDEDGTFQAAGCFRPMGRYSSEVCNSATLGGTALYLVVTGADSVSGTSFTLEIRPQPGNALIGPCTASLNVGTAQSPQEIPDPLRNEVRFLYPQVDASGTSYFQLTAYGNRPHLATLINLTDSVTMEVFGSSGFTPPALCSDTANTTAQCAATPTALALYVRVTAQAGGTCFDISGLAREGSLAAPLSVLADKYTLLMVDTGQSHYRVAVTAGQPYGVELTTVENGVVMTVFNSDGFGGSQECSETAASRQAICSSAITPTGSWLYIRLDGAATTAGSVAQLCVGTCL